MSAIIPWRCPAGHRVDPPSVLLGRSWCPSCESYDRPHRRGER